MMTLTSATTRSTPRTTRTWARPTAAAYEDALAYLLFAVVDSPEQQAMAYRLLRLVTEYGHATVGGHGADASRAGTHLVAGHAAAEAVAAQLRQDMPHDHELHGLTRSVITQLWPPTRQPRQPSPSSTQTATELRRHCRNSAHGVQFHPALTHLTTVATSTEYSAALHQLVAATHRHHLANPRLAETASSCLRSLLVAHV